MSDRIDHGAEAVAALMGSGDGRNFATDASQNAIAHAVLALVEQQRIANLIALSQSEDGNGWTPEQPLNAVFREHWNDETGQGHCTIAPEIAAALGIEPEEDEAEFRARFPVLAGVTDEMVEAGARAVNGLDWTQTEFGEVPHERDIARAVLTAVFGEAVQ